MSFFCRVFSLKRPEESEAAFARRLGVHRTVVREWRLLRDSGREDFLPKPHTLAKIAKTTRRTKSWLAFGEGPEFVPTEREERNLCVA